MDWGRSRSFGEKDGDSARSSEKSAKIQNEHDAFDILCERRDTMHEKGFMTCNLTSWLVARETILVVYSIDASWMAQNICH